MREQLYSYISLEWIAKRMAVRVRFKEHLIMASSYYHTLSSALAVSIRCTPEECVLRFLITEENGADATYEFRHPVDGAGYVTWAMPKRVSELLDAPERAAYMAAKVTDYDPLNRALSMRVNMG